MKKNKTKTVAFRLDEETHRILTDSGFDFSIEIRKILEKIAKSPKCHACGREKK
jgi:hypothetical protein